MKNKTDAFYRELGIEFIGQQERAGKYPLDMFNDLETGSTFIRRPEESIEDMVKRIREVKP